ncbi:MAG TPA: GvpL/GvpF family gas vesicle protein [Pyrinomonadaceae bacterium]|jgi:hypothetical protein
MNLYAYGLSDEITAAALAFEEGAGIEGAKPFLIECGGIRAIVSEFGGERVEVTRANLRAHNRVNGLVLAETTPLPFRFGTVATAAGLVQYVEANREMLLATLERMRGCVEMSVKIMWDVEAMRRASEITDETLPPTAAVEGAVGPGAAYLAAKRREMAASEALKSKAEEIVAWLARGVGDAACETRTEVEPERELVVRVAHLVERVRLDVYRERLQAAREERAGELRFLTSGAWPPYSFSNIASQKPKFA